MIEETLSQYIQVPPNHITRLLKLTQKTIYEDKEYLSWISQLNADLLHETLPQARAAYAQQLPRFSQHLKEKYGLSNTAMSAFTLGNWLVGFLQYPETIINLSQMHSRVPQQAFREMLPEMIQMLDNLPNGKAEWQRALALMAMPLIAARD